MGMGWDWNGTAHLLPSVQQTPQGCCGWSGDPHILRTADLEKRICGQHKGVLRFLGEGEEKGINHRGSDYQPLDDTIDTDSRQGGSLGFQI